MKSSQDDKELYDLSGIRVVGYVRNDAEKIIDIYSFEKIPRNKKGKGMATRSAKSGSWKKNFNSEEKEIMNSIMSSSLKEMDYPI